MYPVKKIEMPIDQVINDLEQKGQWIIEHLRNPEYIQTEDGNGFFNGYYNFTDKHAFFLPVREHFLQQSFLQ